MRIIKFTIYFALPFLSLYSLSLRADELRTLGGKTITGKLGGISASQITLKTDDGPVATPVSQVLTVEVRAVKGLAPGSKATEVRLVDDSLLYCQSAVLKGNNAELNLSSGAALRLPVNLVAWLVRDADNPVLRKKFDDVLGHKSKRDRIVILRDTELSPLEGTLGEIDAEGTTIQFRREGADPIGVRFDRLQGLIFYRASASADTPLCRVYDTDGNVLVASKLALEGASLTLVIAGGDKVKMGTETLARLDFNMGKLTYLSDLEPAKVVERSGIGLITHFRKDMNLDGEPILLDKQYAKGLSLHAHTELTYNLDGKYKDFKAHLGVDARTGDSSQAVVSIYCDGDKRFSETVSAKTQKDIALSVKDVNNLRIVVSGRNFTDLQDHATLADARVSQ